MNNWLFMAGAKVHRVKVYEYSAEHGDRFVKDLHFAFASEAYMHCQYLKHHTNQYGVSVGLVTLNRHVKE